MLSIPNRLTVKFLFEMTVQIPIQIYWLQKNFQSVMKNLTEV